MDLEIRDRVWLMDLMMIERVLVKLERKELTLCLGHLLWREKKKNWTLDIFGLFLSN